MCDLVQDFAKEYAERYAKEYANQQVENERISTAKEMLTDNKPINEILKYSKLTLEKVQELAKEMGKTIVA